MVVWDSGGIHRAVMAKEFLWLHRKRLVTRRFPTYAPELNPDETVWNVAKYQDLPNWCPRNIEQMTLVVKREMGHLKRQPARLRSAIRHAKIPLPSFRHTGRCVAWV